MSQARCRFLFLLTTSFSFTASLLLTFSSRFPLIIFLSLLARAHTQPAEEEGEEEEEQQEAAPPAAAAAETGNASGQQQSQDCSMGGVAAQRPPVVYLGSFEIKGQASDSDAFVRKVRQLGGNAERRFFFSFSFSFCPLEFLHLWLHENFVISSSFFFSSAPSLSLSVSLSHSFFFSYFPFFSLLLALPLPSLIFSLTLQHIQALQKKPGPNVYIEVLKHDVSVVNCTTHDVIIRRPIEKIDHYR